MQNPIRLIGFLSPKRTATGISSLLAFWALVALLLTKVLWGYWSRDLTTGDTSSYFRDAVLWHDHGKINIVWSPLYTAYFGTWLNVSENAAVVTFLHRLGLIIGSTVLVAWLGLITLPRFLAIALTAWWIVLPIHFDTLYEVHLFGALPMLVLAIASCLANNRWRLPVLIGIATVATVLVRNEYVLAVGLFVLLEFFSIFRAPDRSLRFRTTPLSFGLVGIPVILLIAFFYSVSSVKGSAIQAASAPKHTLNMCQVYAFGYQQRASDWAGSPWTGCSDLMQKKFGTPMPTLGQMVKLNAPEVARHFLWNLSLSRAGFEVLLFNATSAFVNPDYAPVDVTDSTPDILFLISLLIILSGVVLITHKPLKYIEGREVLLKMAPLILAALCMAGAVIVTQRPRPSYLLGAGVLYAWLVLMFLWVPFSKVKFIEGYCVPALLVALGIYFIPKFTLNELPSAKGSLGTMYNSLLPYSTSLCKGKGRLALSEYRSELNSYMCAKFNVDNVRSEVEPLNIDSLPVSSFSSSLNFVAALEERGVGSVVIDPFLIFKYPNLQNCAALRDTLLSHGWRQLHFYEINELQCVAAYRKK